MTLSFESLEERAGISISDAVERRQCALYTPTAVSPESASPDELTFPVDDAATVETDSITLPHVVAVYVRNSDGEMLGEAEHYAYQEFPDGEYSIELCSPIKLYLRVDGPLTVSATAEKMTFEFDAETEVLVGARSHHKHPEATITTTSEPRDIMRAVSALSSGLKTTTCERSYPTLRGHPPTIELGDELHVPEELSTPETGVRIELPPEYQYVYVAAPLAYYLGADVVPGSTPRIVTDDGFEHELNTALGFEAEVERVLKQVFFLDCVTRTEGYYQVDLYERTEVEGLVDLDFAALYEKPLSEQLPAYLSVPYAVIQEYVPEWKLTSHVATTPENVETIPFVVNDLAVVRTPAARQVTTAEAQAVAIDDFMRDNDFTRSTAESAGDGPQLVEPEMADSLEQAWIGDDAPLHASKATVNAFRNKLDRTATDGDIHITVICNDAEMADEQDITNRVYGSRDELPFDVTIHRELTTDELRTVLASDTDFLHYIGHIDDRGFQCSDGMLDASTLDTVGVDLFLLNACQSYEQGMELIDAGSVGGIVTLSDVINSGAAKIGRNVARLLNRGFPLRAALNVASDESIIGNQYIVVGDGNMDIAQAESGMPMLCEINLTGDTYELDICAFPSTESDMGSIVIPHIEKNRQYFLGAGKLKTFEMTASELEEFLSLENFPLRIRGKFVWSKEISVNEI